MVDRSSSGEDPLDIINELTDFLSEDENDLFQTLPLPTPIGSMEDVAIVADLSAGDDYDLNNDELIEDVFELLSAESRVPKRSLDEKNTTGPTPLTIASAMSSISPFSSSPPTKKQKLFAPVPCTNQQQQTNQRTDFHEYQCEKWDARLQDLLDFKNAHGHCGVPNILPSNPQLAQWVKRQRYQHKLKTQGKRHTLTDARQQVLEMVGFVWDSHEAAWMERWNELKSFCIQNGHSNVPTNYESNRQLWVWVKCQRRQYKLYQAGRPSNMSMERIIKMERLGFNWNPRNLKL